MSKSGIAGSIHPSPSRADEGEAAPLLAAQPDRRTAGRERRRQVRRAVERVERIRARDARFATGLLAEERLEDVDRGLEPGEPLLDLREWDPEGQVLALVPARTEADDEPAPGRVVEDSGRLGEDRRMAERDRQDAMAQPLPGTWWTSAAIAVSASQSSRRGRATDVRQVVVHPGRVEDVVLADARPRRVEGRPVDALGRGLDPDRDRRRGSQSISPASVAGPGTPVIRGPVVTAPSRRGCRRAPRTWP